MPKKKAGGRIKTLSLFSGAGGLDIGFASAGFEIIASVEINAAYCQTLQHNASRGFFGESSEVLCCDIADFDATRFKNMGIECIIGGPPCQTFSAAGRRSGGVIGTGDARGNLFRHYCRILAELRPSVFVFENVYGLPGANGGEPWREMRTAFEALGYHLSWTVVDAADYGVPQHRERILVVGSKFKRFVFPMPTYGPDSRTGQELISTYDAISDLQVEGEVPQVTLGGMYGHLLPLVPEGLNYSFFTAEMGHPEPVFAWRSKFHDLLYKVARNEPCRTIKAQPGKFTGPFHWNNRHFTAPELKRLQSFPDNYELLGSDLVVMEQIGNSVPPRLAAVMAVSLKDQLLRPKEPLTYAVRPSDFTSTFRQRQRLRTARFKEIALVAIANRYESLPQRKSSDMRAPSGIMSRKLSSKQFIRVSSFFDREVLSHRPPETTHVFSISTLEKMRHVRISYCTLAETRSTVHGSIRLSGLAKWVPKLDELSVDFSINDPIDIFGLWLVLQDALCARSNFFTLIDIYGHYANRGEAVIANTRFTDCPERPVWKALQFLGNSASCGSIVGLNEFADAVTIPIKEVPALVDSLRSIRFDVRTCATHPTIPANSMICTYPFPLLSPKALTESRARVDSGLRIPEFSNLLLLA